MLKKIPVTVDTTTADRQLDELGERVLDASNKALDLTQRAYNSILLVSKLAGQTIPNLFTYIAQFAFMAARVALKTAAIQSLTPLTMAAAVLEVNFALWLFAAGLEAETAGRQVRGEINTIVQLGHIWMR